jgi:hypothetical protein
MGMHEKFPFRPTAGINNKRSKDSQALLWVGFTTHNCRGHRNLPEINREECIMKMSAKRVVLLMGIVLLLDANLVLAAPVDDDATANVTVTVNTIMEWSAASYTDITLTPITAQSDDPTGSTNFTLYTNCNCEISADIDTDAQLKLGTDPNQTLVTSYMLTDDGDGTGTGGTDQASYTVYSSFLSPTAYAITHVAGDGVVVITLYAKAENPNGEVADAGAYSATQTLTASWTSD